MTVIKCSVDGCNKPRVAKGFCNSHYQRWRNHGDPKGGCSRLTSPREAQAWFEKHKDFIGLDCLYWPFARDKKNGYAKIWDGETMNYVHRCLCINKYGPPPTPKHQVAHECGNGRLGCVNPMHVFWKTRIENEADKIKHGKTNRGERQGASKLTETQVLAIRSANNVPGTILAVQYGVDESAISNIRKRRTWKWLEESEVLS